MAIQNQFTLPANIQFGVTALANAGFQQQLTVLVDGKTVGTFTGSGNEKNLGTQIFNSGSGKVQVNVTANGKPSDIVSARLVLANKLNVIVLGSEDSTDYDYNDAIAFLNWPLG